MAQSIKEFVEEQWRAGVSPYTIWHAAQVKFQHKCCGWNYVKGICTKLSNERAKELRQKGEYR